MDITTSAGANNRRKAGFTLVEAVMTIAILAVTMTTMATIIRYSDNSAVQARLDSIAMLEFSKQCQWLVNVPMSSFKESLTEYLDGDDLPARVEVNKDSSPGASAGLLYEPVSYYLMRGTPPSVDAFPYEMTLVVTPGDGTGVDDATHFQVQLTMSYNPPTLLDQSPDAPELVKTFNFVFEKW